MSCKYIRYVERDNDKYEYKQFGGAVLNKGVIYITKEFDKIFNDIILRLKCCLGDMGTLNPTNPNHKKFLDLVKQLYGLKIKELEKSDELKNYKEWHFDVLIINNDLQLKVKNIMIETPEQYIDHFKTYYIPLVYKLFDFAIQLIKEIKYYANSSHVPIYSVPSYRAFLNNRINAQFKNTLASDGQVQLDKDLICSLTDGGDECYIFNIAVYLGKFPLLARELLEKLSLETQQNEVIAEFKEQTSSRVMEINELKRGIEIYNTNMINKHMKPKDFNACVTGQSKYKNFVDKECKDITESDIDEAKKCQIFKKWQNDNTKKCQSVYQNANKKQEEKYGNMRIPDQYPIINNLSFGTKSQTNNSVINARQQPKPWYKFW